LRGTTPTRGSLTFRELETFAGAGLSGFFSLFHARIAAKQAFGLECSSQIGIDLKKRPCNGQLRRTGLSDFRGTYPKQLSGGMRQRASICRALIHDPSILLMDEPFSALDAITRDEIGVELLRIWQANRKTVIFVTHSIREAAFLSDRVLVMGRRPATIVAEFKIDLPRPRSIPMMEEEAFNLHVRALRKAIEASHAS